MTLLNLRHRGRHRSPFPATRWASANLPVVAVLAITAGTIAGAVIRQLNH